MGVARTAIRWTCPLLAVSAALWGQEYKADKAGPPPSELASGISQALAKFGFQISSNGIAYCEIWLRENLPPGTGSHEPNVTLSNIAPGTLLGVIRFDEKGLDRRGQQIQAGVYTLRYAVMPMNGSHEGAAPQRDFLLLTPAAEDRDLNAITNFDALMTMSRKASHTAHPAVLSLRKADADSPGFSQQGDTDWVLESKVGDTPVVIVVVGTSAS